MALTKKQRQEVWNKSNGYCWYCGCKLPQKGWHADHVEAVIRESELVPKDERKNRFAFELRPTGKMHNAKNDKIENIVPSCAPCNLFKNVWNIDEFRYEIAQQVERARKTSVNFRTAERFGTLEIIPVAIEFWFERQGL